MPMATERFEDKEPAERGKSDEKDGSAYFAPVMVGLCVLLAGWMAYWHFHNRKWIGPTFGADIEFVQAPETVPAGAASRFTVHVAQDNNERPLAGRPMDIKVTPADKAEIISVSGAAGVDSAKVTRISGSARGETDASGNLDIMVRAMAPGKYTLVALDSASNQEGTVNFQVSQGPEPGDEAE